MNMFVDVVVVESLHLASPKELKSQLSYHLYFHVRYRALRNLALSSLISYVWIVSRYCWPFEAWTTQTAAKHHLSTWRQQELLMESSWIP